VPGHTVPINVLREPPITPVIIGRQHPANAGLQFAIAGKDAEESVFMVVINVAEVLVLHGGYSKISFALFYLIFFG